jgi:hypothetical protein
MIGLLLKWGFRSASDDNRDKAKPDRKNSHHRRRQRAAGEKSVQIRQHQFAHGRAGFDRGAALMRFQHDILKREQRFGHVRLAGEHVQTGAAQPAFPQRFDQFRFIDDAAARHIDQNARSGG